MEYDKDKVDEMVLALLYLTSSKNQFATRAWKGIDLATMDRLHEKGYISDPKSKARSVVMTDKGLHESEKLFQKHFCLPE